MGVVAEPPASRMIQPRSGQETLPAHLEARYGIQVGAMTELDLGGYGWAGHVSDLREVLRAHGRPLPQRAPADRHGEQNGHRPRALLIRATLDHGHACPAPEPAAPEPATPDPAARDRATSERAAPEPAAPEPAAPEPAAPEPATADPATPDPATPNRSPQAAPARQARKPGRRDRGATVLVADLRFSALLSQALVAFTIEFHNEAEHQLPHRTTWGPAADSGRGPWLVSLAMWSGFMRFLPAAGVPLREVADLVPLTNLAGLERWGYVTVGPGPADSLRRCRAGTTWSGPPGGATRPSRSGRH